MQTDYDRDELSAGFWRVFIDGISFDFYSVISVIDFIRMYPGTRFKFIKFK